CLGSVSRHVSFPFSRCAWSHHRSHPRRREALAPVTPVMKTVDVASVLDEGRWSAYQKLLVAGTALAIILDGMDTQLLGNVIPALMKEWSLPRAPFTTVLAL